MCLIPCWQYAPQVTHSLAMHTKMMAYDRVITELNSHRLAGTPHGVIAALKEAANSANDDVCRPCSGRFGFSRLAYRHTFPYSP